MHPISPTVTWELMQVNTISVVENIPNPENLSDSEATSVSEALDYMKLDAGAPIKGTPIDVAFIGSCTNGRISDLEEVASRIEGRKGQGRRESNSGSGSQVVSKIAEEKGLDRIFTSAIFEWRNAGCSMCLAMNPDKLIGDQLS